MPLTQFQTVLARLLAKHRSQDSHLAGGAAMHIEPNSSRYSNDLDYFNDSEARVGSAFSADRNLLEEEGYSVLVALNRPGFVRATVARGDQQTKVEWAHDSAWRFVPAIEHKLSGYQLHPIDLAINKVLTLVGRDEARDFLDVLYACENVLPLGALCWAAVGKDPGFSPLSLLELLKRRGKYQPTDFSRLHLVEPVDLMALKTQWRSELEAAEVYIASLDPSEAGCLYYSTSQKNFVAKLASNDKENGTVVPHFGRPGGVLPQLLDD